MKTKHKSLCFRRKHIFFETATNHKIFNPFFDFFRGPNFFGLKTAEVFSVRTAPIWCTKGRKRRKITPFSTKAHFLNQQQKKNQEFFFRFFSGFLVVGPLTDKTGPQPTKWPATPQKRPHLGPQGHMGPQTRRIGCAFSMGSNLVGGCFRPEWPPRPGKSTFWRFWPVSAPGRPRNFSKSPKNQ